MRKITLMFILLFSKILIGQTIEYPGYAPFYANYENNKTIAQVAEINNSNSKYTTVTVHRKLAFAKKPISKKIILGDRVNGKNYNLINIENLGYTNDKKAKIEKLYFEKIDDDLQSIDLFEDMKCQDCLNFGLLSLEHTKDDAYHFEDELDKIIPTTIYIDFDTKLSLDEIVSSIQSENENGKNTITSFNISERSVPKNPYNTADGNADVKVITFEKNSYPISIMYYLESNFCISQIQFKNMFEAREYFEYFGKLWCMSKSPDGKTYSFIGQEMFKFIVLENNTLKIFNMI